MKLLSGSRRRIVRQSLGLRLGASYALVALVALMSITAVNTISDESHGVIDSSHAGVIAIIQKDAAQAASFMRAVNPSPAAVSFLVTMPTLSDVSQGAHGHPVLAAVINTEGRIVAASSCTQSTYLKTSRSCDKSAQAIIESFLSSRVGSSTIAAEIGDVAAGSSHTGVFDRHGFVVALIPGQVKQSLGELVVVFQGLVPVVPHQSTISRLIFIWSTNWPRNWLILSLTTTIIGTLLGHLLSRRLVNRVRKTASIVRIWSRGELEPVAPVDGGDELSLLGRDLNFMAEQIRNLLEVRQEFAAQQERLRVRLELHDGLKQQLFGVNMQLASADALVSNGSDRLVLKKTLQTALDLSRKAQEELSAIVERQRPRALNTEGFTQAIEELIEDVSERTDLMINLQVSGSIEVALTVEDELYRIIQEALFNVERHARATRVWVAIHSFGGKVDVSVTDDGVGLVENGEREGGLGIGSMRLRAKSIGAQFEISNESPGTRVRVVIPSSRALE